MSYKFLVLAKQVPDTENITGDAMKEDGTVNRGALPTIFNPEDLLALEMAISQKDKTGATVTVISMGPPKAIEVLKSSLCRGADRVVLLSDMKFAGADTLATSLVLSAAIKKAGNFDIVFCGSQAIDGDTAQVGPQTAEKLGLAQITYVEDMNIEDRTVCARRGIEGGYEIVESAMPVLVTVSGNAPEARPASAKLTMQYKKVMTAGEAGDKAAELEKKGLLVEQWGIADLGLDPEKCGRKGSPTNVVKIESVVLSKTDTTRIEPTDEGISGLIHQLREEHVL